VISGLFFYVGQEFVQRHIQAAFFFIPQFDAGGQGGPGGPVETVGAGEMTGDEDHRDGCPDRGAFFKEWVDSGQTGQGHGFTDQGIVVAGGDLADDTGFLVLRLIIQDDMFKAILEGFREMAGRDVFHGILGGNDEEPRLSADGADLGQDEESFIQRGEQDILNRFRHPIQLIDEEDGALAHGQGDGALNEGLRTIAGGEDLLGIEPTGELGFGIAVVAIDPDRGAVQVTRDGEGDGGFADADGAFEQEMSVGLQDRQGEGQFLIATDDAMVLLDLVNGTHGRRV